VDRPVHVGDSLLFFGAPLAEDSLLFSVGAGQAFSATVVGDAVI